jgi:hypothetical protein
MINMKNILCIISLLLTSTIFADDTCSRLDIGCNGYPDGDCVDNNPEIILDLGGSPEPETIIYSTYSSCTEDHSYCGALGCQLNVYDDKGKYTLGYLVKDDWYIRPAKVLGKKPTYELVIPGIDSLLIINVINDKLTETAVNS